MFVPEWETFKDNIFKYVNLNSPVVGHGFLIHISSPVQHAKRVELVKELVDAGEIASIEISGHPMCSAIYLRKDIVIEVSSKHSSCKPDSVGYHRIGHGKQK